MCSIEPRLGTDRSRFAMIDSSSPQASSGLATALRDRSSCKIPNQPNRSLPVRPAPHTPCRSFPPRRTLQPQPLQSPTKHSTDSSSTSVATSSNQEEDRTNANVGIIRIGVQNWQNDIRQPYINIINLSATLDKPPDSGSHRGTKRSSPESENNVSTSNSTFIDISHSPERSDSSKIDAPVSSSLSDTTKATTTDQDTLSKKKRRKKLKKDDEKIEINLEPSKIVPPLRLKKIQTLQEDVTSVATTWGNLKKPEPPQEPIPGFRFYQPQQQEPEIVDDSSKYRIVSGTTPPYDESVDSSTVQSGDGQKDDKLRFKQNKLKVKLRELKRKTVELGREMLRTALTSPDTSVQETIDSYEEQIEKLTNLLKKLPEAASSISANDRLEELLPSIVTSTIPGQGKSLPIITDLLSPEPPKLSPKIQSDYENQNQEVRSSPPVLQKATFHSEDTEDTWQEFEGLRGLLKISRKGKDRKNVEKSADVTTTVDSVHEEIDLDSKNDILETGLNEITKTEISVGEVKTIEIRTLGQVQEVMKIDLRDTPSLGGMIIDTTSVLQEFEKRSEPTADAIEAVNLAGNLNVGVSEGGVKIRTPAPIISSTCEENKNSGNKDLTIDDQFPSLGNWLARMSAKIPNDLSVNQAEEKREQIVIESRSPAFQGNIQMYNQGKATGVEINGSGGLEGGRGWREEKWKGQEPRIQQNSGGYGNGGVGIGGTQMVNQQTGQQMGQEYCPPPMSIGRYYPRNYPIDPYGIPYGYNHPAIAASLWSGAILQYPYLRPRGLPPGYQSRLPANSLQYSLPMGPMPPPRPPPPPYALASAAQSPQDVSRTPNMTENQRNPQGAYDPGAITKRNDHPPVSHHQSSANINNQRIQQPRDQYGRVYADPGTRTPISDGQRDQIAYRQSWRGPMLPPGPIPQRNYPINPNWTSDPCSLLAALSPSALQNYSTQVPMVQRNRSNKDTIELVRNCETPHLGKVNYSPNTAKTLECSNCTSPGPLFKCLGCEVAFYCDETCQTRHWNRHVISCPKKMPKLKKVVP